MLGFLQDLLQRLYALHVPYDVGEFVITDARLARLLDDSPTARETPEKLLVRQDGDCVDLSLYLDAAVVERLERDSPEQGLHAGNIDDFCIALEGVSHFLYLAWNAGKDRSVRLLELELQAEVDKYAAIATLLRLQAGGRIPAWLRRWLFDNARFDPRLAPEEHARYRDANHFAARYCRHLERRFSWRWNSLASIRELRHFYRLSQPAKISHITACA